MANRTFKVYGQAYAASGDVTAVLSVGGVEVFNGAVNDSSTVRNGQPTTSNHLFTFTLDEATTGGMAYSLTATGGELCLGQTEYNGIPSLTISQDWFETNVPDDSAVSAEAQTHIADTLGESALGSDLYNALKAGTITDASDEQHAKILAENTIATDFTVYGKANDTRANGQIDGSSMAEWNDDAVNKANWPILEDGQAFTCTWNLDPTTAELNS